MTSPSSRAPAVAQLPPEGGQQVADEEGGKNRATLGGQVVVVVQTMVGQAAAVVGQAERVMAADLVQVGVEAAVDLLGVQFLMCLGHGGDNQHGEDAVAVATPE